MFIVVDKDTNEFLNNAATAENENEKEVLETIVSGLDENTESLIHVDNSSPLVKVFNALDDEHVKVIIEDQEAVGIKIMRP